MSNAQRLTLNINLSNCEEDIMLNSKQIFHYLHIMKPLVMFKEKFQEESILQHIIACIILSLSLFCAV